MNIGVGHASGQRGQTLIIAVLSMGVLMGLTAMAIDAGLFYEDRRHFQNSADAMALSGVAELPLNPAQATARAEEWAANNDIDASEIKTIDVRTTGFPNDTLYVELEGDFSWIFARVLGHTTDKVGAEAAARIGTLAGGNNMMPWALLQGATECLDEDGHAIFDEECAVKFGAQSGINGWRGALDFDGSGGGGNEYRENIIDGESAWSYCIAGQDPPPCHSVVDALQGNKEGPTGQGIGERLAQGAQCDANHDGEDGFDEVFEPTGLASPQYTVACPNSPWLIIIPIVSYDSEPVHEVTIRGWSLAYLHGYSCYSDTGSANPSEGRAVVFGARSVTSRGAVTDSAVSDISPTKPCHHDKAEVQRASPAEDTFVMALGGGGAGRGGRRGPHEPPRCHDGTPHGQQQCTPSPTPTPPPPPTPTPTPDATPTPEPSSTPGPTPVPEPSSACASGKGHWEVQIEIADAAYSQSAGFLGNYDPTSGVIVRRLIQ